MKAIFPLTIPAPVRSRLVMALATPKSVSFTSP
jgi:hypothetical protein